MLREFFLPSLTAILQNVVLILALVLVCRHYRGMFQLKMFGLAVLVAGVLEMALIFLILWRRGMMVRISGAIMRDHETLLSIWKLILPGLLGASALQLSLQCDRLIAGFIGTMVLMFVSTSLSGLFIVAGKLRQFFYWQLAYAVTTFLSVWLGGLLFDSMEALLILFSVTRCAVYAASIVMTRRYAKGRTGSDRSDTTVE